MSHATIYISLLIFLVSHSCLADSPSEEIDMLLEQVKYSNCVFIRNDIEHTPKEAEKHMREKYAYFKEKIRTAEDFIEYCATKSLVTGKPYYLICEGKIIETSKYLINILMEYRKKNKTSL